MSAGVFVDTNIFVYSFVDNEPLKQPLAHQWIERLWKEQTGRTSMQVLNECYWTLTRKVKPRHGQREAWARVQSFLEWEPLAIDSAVVLRARELEQDYRLSWWDALIVSAALAQNCSLLLSEDMQDRATYGTVTVRNPFVLGVSEAAAEYGAVPTASRPYRPRGRPKRPRYPVPEPA